MPRAIDRVVDQLAYRQALSAWRRAAEAAPGADAATLAHQRRRAVGLRTLLDRVIREADSQVAARSARPIPQPPGTDVAWRPALWRAPVAAASLARPAARTDLCEGISLHHDCPRAEIALRQTAAADPGAPAPFALRVEVFGFDGSFLSLAIALPPQAVEGLRSRHIIAVQTQLALERPRPVYLRLNVRHGPNLEQMIQDIAAPDCGGLAEFDLSYGGIDERRVEEAWLDVLFDNPAMNAFRLDDLTVTRRPRAAM